MADEATLYIQTGPAIPFTVADGTAITKGSLLQLNDEFTAIAPTAEKGMVAGIAATDKIASDGKTKLGIFRDGIFVMTGSGNITAGDPVGIGGNNRVISMKGDITASGSTVLGIALSTSTDGQTMYVDVRPHAPSFLVV